MECKQENYNERFFIDEENEMFKITFTQTHRAIFVYHEF